MASARKTPAAPVLDETRVQAELWALRRRLKEDGAVKRSSLKPKALAARLLPALEAEGFETSGAWLRCPLGVQLERALAHGAVLSRKALAAQVRGASAAELQRAVAEAERTGQLRRILRGKVEAWAASSAAVLSGAELQRLRAAVAALDKALAQALRKQGTSLLLSDVEQALAEARQLLPTRAEPSRSNGDEALRSVVAAVGAARDQHSGLAFVPDIVRRLLPAMPAAVAREMLLEAARRELVELRPEGGLGRLTAEDLVLCPPGPAHTHLSWARLLAGGQS